MAIPSHHGMAAGWFLCLWFLFEARQMPPLFREVIHPGVVCFSTKSGWCGIFPASRCRVIQELIAFQPIISHFMCFLETTAGFLFWRDFQAPNVFSRCRNQAMLESHLVTDSQRQHIRVQYFMISIYMMYNYRNILLMVQKSQTTTWDG